MSNIVRKLLDTKEAIKLWKELEVVRAEFEFSCGGDSMNDTTINFYNKKNGRIESQELDDYFDEQVYKEVTFYEASDGHYQGEAGVVHIELDTDSDDEADHDFTYNKDSQAEYNESFTQTLKVKLNKKQIEFIQENVGNMNGGEDSGFAINYKRDFIMTDEHEKLVMELEELLCTEARGYQFTNAQGEPTDWFNWTTNEDNIDELTINGNKLEIQISRTFVIYSQSDW